MVGFFSGLLPENSLFQPLMRPLFQVELPQDEVFQDQVFLLNLPSAYVLVRLHNLVKDKVLIYNISQQVFNYSSALSEILLAVKSAMHPQGKRSRALARSELDVTNFTPIPSTVSGNSPTAAKTKSIS